MFSFMMYFFIYNSFNDMFRPVIRPSSMCCLWGATTQTTRHLHSSLELTI